MVNIESTRQTILENVNLGQLLEALTPGTMAGSTWKQKLVQMYNENRLNSVTALTEIIFESSKLGTTDEAFLTFGQSISEHLSESIQSKLVYCAETVAASRTNALNEKLLSKIDMVLENKESEAIIQHLRSGILQPFQSINVVGFITESIKVATEETGSTDIHEAFKPVSYIEKDTNGTIFVRLGQKVIGINESVVQYVSAPSPKFAYMSSIVEAMTYDAEASAFAIQHKSLGKFIISEGSVTRIVDETETVCENMQDFVQTMSLIVEAKADSVNKVDRQTIQEQKQFVDAVVSLKNNMSNLAYADNIVMVENKKFHEKFAMILTEDFTYIATIKSNRKTLLLEKFSDVRDALARLQAQSGYDAKHFVTEQLAKVAQLDEAKQSQIEAQTLVVEALEEQAIEISKAIAEEKRNTKPNARVLEKLKEASNLNKGHLTEQRTILSDLFN